MRGVVRSSNGEVWSRIERNGKGLVTSRNVLLWYGKVKQRQSEAQSCDGTVVCGFVVLWCCFVRYSGAMVW